MSTSTPVIDVTGLINSLTQMLPSLLAITVVMQLFRLILNLFRQLIPEEIEWSTPASTARGGRGEK